MKISWHEITKGKEFTRTDGTETIVRTVAAVETPAVGHVNRDTVMVHYTEGRRTAGMELIKPSRGLHYHTCTAASFCKWVRKGK